MVGYPVDAYLLPRQMPGYLRCMEASVGLAPVLKERGTVSHSAATVRLYLFRVEILGPVNS